MDEGPPPGRTVSAEARGAAMPRPSGVRRTVDRPMRGRRAVREGRATRRAGRTPCGGTTGKTGPTGRRIGFVLTISGLQARGGGAGEPIRDRRDPATRRPGEASRSPGCARRAETDDLGPVGRRRAIGRTGRGDDQQGQRQRAHEPDRPAQGTAGLPGPDRGQAIGLAFGRGPTRGRKARRRGGPRDPLHSHGGRRRRWGG